MASANLVNENTGDLIPYGGIVTPYVRDSIAPLFSTSISFAKGTYCYHEGTLYECTTAHPAGAWNPSHFTEKTVGGKLSEKQDIIDNSLTTTDKTIPGAINELKSGLTSVSSSVNGVYWGTYPNGQSNGLVRVIVPTWNPDGKTASVTNAYVYDSTGAYTDIKSSAVIGNTTKAYTQVNITFDATHAGKLLLVDVSLA